MNDAIAKSVEPTKRPGSRSEKLIARLGLQPHPEGGWYRETYRSSDLLSGDQLDARYGGRERAVSTCIYYLLTQDSFSAMHKVQSDEIYHFYAGDPLEVLLLLPDKTSQVITMGPDPLAGHASQFVIPRGWWQGSRVMGGGEFSLIGATVAPGFDFADFEMGKRADLYEQYPDAKDMIRKLTRLET